MAESKLTEATYFGGHILSQAKDGMLVSAAQVFDEEKEQSIQDTIAGLEEEIASIGSGSGGGSGSGDTSDCVHKTGNETIAGVKTFSSVPKTTGTPSISASSTDLVTAKSIWSHLNQISTLTDLDSCDSALSPNTEYNWSNTSVPSMAPIAIDKGGVIRVFEGSSTNEGDRVQLSFMDDGSVWSRYYDASNEEFSDWVSLDPSGLALVASTGNYNDLQNRPTIDALMSSTSTNAIQNKAAKAYIDGLISDTYTKSEITELIQGFVSSSTLNSYATKEYVATAIAEASLEGGDVDLSSYATKSYVDGDKIRIDQDYFDALEPETYVANLNGDHNFQRYVLEPGNYILTEDLNLGGKRLVIKNHSTLDFFGHTMTNGRLWILEDPSNVFINCYRSFTTSLTMFAEKGGVVEFEWWQFQTWTDGQYREFCKTVYELKDSEYPQYTTAIDNFKDYYEENKDSYTYEDPNTGATKTYALYAALRVETDEIGDIYKGEREAAEFYRAKNLVSTTNNDIIKCITIGVAGDRYYGTTSERGVGDAGAQQNGTQTVIRFGRNIYPFKERIKEFYWSQNCRIEGLGRTITCLVFLDKGFIIENAFIFDIKDLCITSVRACISFESAAQHSPGCMTLERLYLVSLRANCVDAPSYLDELNSDDTKKISQVVINKSTFDNIIFVPGARCSCLNNCLSTTAIFNNLSDFYKTYRDLYQLSDHGQASDGSPVTADYPVRPCKAFFSFSTVPGNVNNTYADQCGVIGKISNVAWCYGRKFNNFIWCEAQSLSFSELTISYCHLETNTREKARFFYTEGVEGHSSQDENNCRLVLRLIGNRFHGVYDEFANPLISTSSCILTGDLNNTDLGSVTGQYVGAHYVCVQSANFVNNTPATIKNVHGATVEEECSIIGPVSFCDAQRNLYHKGAKVKVTYKGERNPYAKISDDFNRDYFKINLASIEDELVTKFNTDNVSLFNYYGIDFHKNSGCFNICGDTQFICSLNQLSDLTVTKNCFSNGWNGLQIAGCDATSFNLEKRVSIKNSTPLALRIKGGRDTTDDGRIFTLLPWMDANLDKKEGFIYKYLKGSVNTLFGGERVLFNAFLGKQYDLSYRRNLTAGSGKTGWINNMNSPLRFTVYDAGDSGIAFASKPRKSSTRYNAYAEGWAFNDEYSYREGLDDKYFTVPGTDTMRGSVEYVYYCIVGGTTSSSTSTASFGKNFNDIITDGDAVFVCLGVNARLELSSGSGKSTERATLSSKSGVDFAWRIAPGATWFDTDTSTPLWYNGSSWVEGSTGSGSGSGSGSVELNSITSEMIQSLFS